MNADVEFLIKEIDKILNPEFSKKAPRTATIYVSAYSLKKEKEKNNSKNNSNSISPKKNKNNRFVSMGNIGMEVINQLNSLPEPSPLPDGILEIENETEDIIQKNNNNDLKLNFENNKEIKVIKKVNSSNQIRNHSYSINSKSTFYTSDLDIDNLKKNKTIASEEDMLLNEKHILPNYVDEFETENITIGHYKNKELKMISLNLLLKKIIISNFMEKNFNNVNNFIQQCFSFIDIETLFSKIINCYNYYEQLNIPFDQLKNMIQFTNGLIIEMYCYYQNQKIDQKIISIKKFYNDIQNDLQIKIKNKTKSNFNLCLKYEEILTEIQYIFLLFDSAVPNLVFLRSVKTNLYYYKLYKKYFVEKNKNDKNNNDNQKMKKNKSVEKRHIKIFPELKPFSNTTENYQYFSLKNYSPTIIGEKLKNITINNLNKIQYKELYKAVFLKKTKSQMCPNVMFNIKYFNNLISFIIEDILSYDLSKIRAEIISEWLNVAKYCKSINDYSDCIAIYSALNHYLINGLTQTWKELKSSAKNIFKTLSHFCSCEANYKYLRENMNKLDNQEFYIPYLGMLMKDISFNEESMKYLINGNLINFEKLETVRKLIDDFFRYKNIMNNNKTNVNSPKELNFFEHLQDIEEQYLENIAYALEPKFTLDLVPRKEKRYTEIDRKFFGAGKNDGNVMNNNGYIHVNRRSVI